MTIEERIERLEKICLGAETKNDGELTLKKLTIQDDQGRDRIVMAGGKLEFYDEKGELRIVAETDADGLADVSQFDGNEKRRIWAYTDADGNAGVFHADVNEKKRIDIYTDADGGAHVIHFDGNDKERITTITTEDNEAQTYYKNYDTNGKLEVVKTLP